MSREIKADLCIIGAGSGGLSVAAGAAMLGRKVVLCEKGEMGGDCLNYGCVPSKALIAAAKSAAAARDSSKYGVGSHEPEVDFKAVMAHVRSVIAAIAPVDSQERFEGLGCTVIRESARFIGPRLVEAGNARIAAKHFVVASGSRAFVPPIPGLATSPYLTNETIFGLEQRPKHLLIIGGGPIGLELGLAFRRLGSAVTIIEAARILAADEPEVADIVRAVFARDGVALREETQAQSVRSEGGDIVIETTAGAVRGSHLLVATGRRANVEDLGLERAGVGVDKKGVVVDARLRSANKRVYAVGDAAGGAQFTHVAGDHASTIIRNVLFKTPAKRRDALAPRAIYIDPEVASVGLTEAAAREKHPGARAVKWKFEENDRAQTERDLEGFAKIVADKSGRILGGTIVGAGAADLIAPLSLSLANGLKIVAFTKLIAAYPTRSEALKRAAGQWYAPTLFSKRTQGFVRLLAIFD